MSNNSLLLSDLVQGRAAPAEPTDRRARRWSRNRPHAGGGQVLPIESLRKIATELAGSPPPTGLSWDRAAGRRYARLADTARYDAWLISWSPGSCLELHDHSGSVGAVAIVAGRLVEISTDLRWRQPVRTRVAFAGGVFGITKTCVHEVTNPGPGDALSVHVYSPPLRSMTFFDSRPPRFLTPLYRTEGDLTLLREEAT